MKRRLIKWSENGSVVLSPSGLTGTGTNRKSRFGIRSKIIAASIGIEIHSTTKYGVKRLYGERSGITVVQNKV